jgi:hypothetical protein
MLRKNRTFDHRTSVQAFWKITNLCGIAAVVAVFDGGALWFYLSGTGNPAASMSH